MGKIPIEDARTVCIVPSAGVSLFSFRDHLSLISL